MSEYVVDRDVREVSQVTQTKVQPSYSKGTIAEPMQLLESDLVFHYDDTFLDNGILDTQIDELANPVAWGSRGMALKVVAKPVTKKNDPKKKVLLNYQYRLDPDIFNKVGLEEDCTVVFRWSLGKASGIYSYYPESFTASFDFDPKQFRALLDPQVKKFNTGNWAANITVQSILSSLVERITDFPTFTFTLAINIDWAADITALLVTQGIAVVTKMALSHHPHSQDYYFLDFWRSVALEDSYEPFSETSSICSLESIEVVDEFEDFC